MNRKYLFLIWIFLFFILFSCNKVKNPASSGIFIYGSDKMPWILRTNTSGMKVENGNINFFYTSDVTGTAARSQIDFNPSTKAISNNLVFNSDSAHFIIELFSVSPQMYIARTKNLTIDTILFGELFHPEKLELIDINGKVYKEFNVDVYSYGFPSFSGVLPLANGNIIACFGYRSLYYQSVRMYCLDKNLTLLWSRDVYSGKRSSRFIDFLGLDNSFYLLSKQEFGVDMVKTYEFDFNGVAIDSTEDLMNGLIPLRILPASNGFKVLGSYYDATKQNSFAIASYDKGCNLLSLKYLEKEKFAANNEDIIFDNLTFEYNPLDYAISNIIYHQNKYYFTILVTDNSGNTGNRKNKFVRLSESFELEKITSIETGELNITSYRYLIQSGGNRFISIGSGKWNKLAGISFIETDLDGKIIN